MKLIVTLFILGCATATFAAVAKPTCGGSSSSKNIQLLNPANPPRECVYNFNAYSTKVCQIRIDFKMTLAQPAIPSAANSLKYVQCIDDYFMVNDEIKLCGVETNQHVYIPFNRTAGVKTVSVKIALAVRNGLTNLPTPSWDMMVTQLECPDGAAIREIDVAQPESRSTVKDGFFVAPPGCLQYYPNFGGRFTSFNFNNGKGAYPGHLNYAICFRRDEDTKFLEIVPYYFHLGAEYENTAALQMDNYCYSHLRTNDVSEDYLMIPEAQVLDDDVRATYFCGDSLGDSIIRSTNPGPLMVLFNSDGLYKQKETGFDLYYRVM